MKCINSKCGGEWTPPPGKSLTVCPFCGEQISNEKKASQSLDNVADALVYIKEQLGVEMLLGEKAYTCFADLTRNQFRDETDLIKQLCDKGSLDCLKAAIGKPDSEHENAIKHALSKLPKYLQDSPAVAGMLHDFAVALGWAVQQQAAASQSPKSSVVAQGGNSTGIIVASPVGGVINVADIDWRVLAVENNKALLISEKILEKRPYNVELKDITWENCTLRKYLNGEFFNKLGAIKSAIAETHNSNPNNPWYGAAGGNTTTDKVFLLSLDEVCRYFGDSTANLNKNGSTRSDYWIADGNTSARIANYGSEGASWWWLRSHGYDGSRAADVCDDGRVDIYGFYVHHVSGGVRPTLWLNL